MLTRYVWWVFSYLVGSKTCPPGAVLGCFRTWSGLKRAHKGQIILVFATDEVHSKVIIGNWIIRYAFGTRYASGTDSNGKLGGTPRFPFCYLPRRQICSLRCILTSCLSAFARISNWIRKPKGVLHSGIQIQCCLWLHKIFGLFLFVFAACFFLRFQM